MPDPSLVILASDVRAKTLRILGDVTELRSRFAPSGLHNTILWHAGHVLVVVEHLAVAPATAQPAVLPPGWFEKFSWNSRPQTIADWPTLAEVKVRLADQSERLIRLLQDLTDEQLSAATIDPNLAPTLRGSIIHALHDEACHQGEIWLLQKLQASGC